MRALPHGGGILLAVALSLGLWGCAGRVYVLCTGQEDTSPKEFRAGDKFVIDPPTCQKWPSYENDVAGGGKPLLFR